jgi:hypothetical protein
VPADHLHLADLDIADVSETCQLLSLLPENWSNLATPTLRVVEPAGRPLEAQLHYTLTDVHPLDRLQSVEL